MKFARKFAYLVLFVMPVLFQACNKDDEPTPEELLIGTWTLSDQNIEIFLDGQKIPEALYSQFGIDPDTIQAFPDSTTIAFSADNTYTVSAPNDNGGTDTGTGTWSLSSDAKTLTIDATEPEGVEDTGPLDFDIETLTQNKAIINYSQEGPVEYQGNTYDVRVDILVTFVK